MRLFLENENAASKFSRKTLKQVQKYAFVF